MVLVARTIDLAWTNPHRLKPALLKSNSFLALVPKGLAATTE